VAEPLLNLGNIGLMIKRIGGRRRPKRMGADLESQERRVRPNQLVYAIRSDGFLPAAARL
jgi:hypothetical protein